MRRSLRSRLDHIWSNFIWRWVIVAVFSVLLVAIAARAAYQIWPEWTGFGEKTLWDLLELLIVPAALGIVALFFNKAVRDRENEITDDQQREEALQNYLDKIAELLLEKQLLKKKDNLDNPVVDVAQIRTITTLRILDRDRRNILFQFLRDANLADFILVKASLTRADLSNTDILGINLNRANLNGADLVEANLRGANLGGAILREANLSSADLRYTDLRGVYLTGAKYNSQTKWPEGFDYENSGAILVDE